MIELFVLRTLKLLVISIHLLDRALKKTFYNCLISFWSKVEARHLGLRF